MARLHDKRVCPFCGVEIKLGDCPIVATADDYDIQSVQKDQGFGGNSWTTADTGSPGAEQGGNEGGDGHETSEVAVARPGRGRLFGGRRVLAEAPLVGTPVRLRDRLFSTAELPRPEELAPRETLPARACPRCEQALPRDFDDRRMFTVALIGSPGAGKSHYLASLYTEATHDQMGLHYGVTEFAPDELTSGKLEEKYYVPVYLENKTIPGTNSHNANADPFFFRVALEDSEPFGLVLHDPAGEDLRNPGKRQLHAGFVARADALLFLIDPFSLPKFRRLARGEGQQNRYFNQAALLRACVDELDDRQARVPVAITLSKSDAIARVVDRKFRFNDQVPTNAAEMASERSEIDSEVKELLADLGSAELLVETERLSNVSYHAIAPLGCDPENDSIPELAPRRCLEPLASLLARIDDVPPAVNR